MRPLCGAAPPLSAECADGEYRLGVRVSFELSEYLEETYGRDKVPGCNLCSYTVLQGVRCPEKRCSVQLHFHCARDWFGSKVPKNVRFCTTHAKRRTPERHTMHSVQHPVDAAAHRSAGCQ